jgi:hypothetical protein
VVIVRPRNLLGAGPGGEAHGPQPASAETRLLSTYLAALSAALPALHPAAALPTARALCEFLAAGRVIAASDTVISGQTCTPPRSRTTAETASPWSNASSARRIAASRPSREKLLSPPPAICNTS